MNPVYIGHSWVCRPATVEVCQKQVTPNVPQPTVISATSTPHIMIFGGLFMIPGSSTLGNDGRDKANPPIRVKKLLSMMLNRRGGGVFSWESELPIDVNWFARSWQWHILSCGHDRSCWAHWWVYCAGDMMLMRSKCRTAMPPCKGEKVTTLYSQSERIGIWSSSRTPQTTGIGHSCCRWNYKDPK